jgi:hypothetical protein
VLDVLAKADNSTGLLIIEKMKRILITVILDLWIAFKDRFIKVGHHVIAMDNLILRFT